jgi:hypothetical protein
VSIDKLIVRCFGKYVSLPSFLLPRYLANYFRSLHIYKMLKKLIKQGYKIYGIADYRYIYNWLWSSREKRLQDIVLYSTLTNTGSLVRNLALSFPRRYLIIYLNNYFISIPLFLELRACNFGVVGTIRPYKEFLEGLAELKNQFFIKLE